ncbi:MAG TPA: beta-galactosidase, partial [Bacillota bacterium]|nr:beta-galactosidase [Bacillota bacterium]
MRPQTKSRPVLAAGRAAVVIGWACLGLSCAPLKQAGVTSTAPSRGPGFQQVALGIGEDYPQEARTLAAVQRDLQVCQTNGLKVLRISFPWDAIEPEPGRYEWGFWDTLVSLATDQYGPRLVPYVCYTPRWASSSQGEDFWHQPPKDTTAFANFMKKIVMRYRSRIHSWEIWNEPDNPAYWLGSVEQFASLLAAGSQAVRQTDPNVKIVMGGLAWNLNFLEALLTNAPALTNIDIINLHNYYETWSDDPLERLPDYLGRASDVLRSHGQHQPLWMAEVGYSTFRRGPEVSGQFRAFYGYEHTPEHQAASLFRVLSMLLASGKVSLITWYRINDLPGTQEVIGDVNNRHLGVLDEHGRPKPALQALRYFQALFANGFRRLDDQVQVAKTVSAPVVVHAFERPDRSVVVTAWLKTVVLGERGFPTSGQAPDTRQATIDLLLPVHGNWSAKVFNELGQPRGTIALGRHHGQSLITGLPLRDGTVTVLVLEP